MWKRTMTALLFLIMLTPDAARAVEPDEVLEDPALEARARLISRDLRCVVCQSENIDDSNAPLAKDLRLLVRERLLAGDSDREVIAYVAERYGDYVLLKPPVQRNTLFLWAAPALFVLAAGGGAFLLLRRSKPAPAEALSAAEQAAIDEMLR